MNRSKPHIEPHYKPAQLAKMWNVAPNTIRRWFADEPGVLIVEHPEEVRKRGYASMRIPDSVAERVHAKYQVR